MRVNKQKYPDLVRDHSEQPPAEIPLNYLSLYTVDQGRRCVLLKLSLLQPYVSPEVLALRSAVELLEFVA